MRSERKDNLRRAISDWFMGKGVAMVQVPEHDQNYDEWPDPPDERLTVARDIFGAHIVASYDTWIAIASRILFEGYRPQVESEAAKQLPDWINSLDGVQRAGVLRFAKYVTNGMMFSVLSDFDGAAGSYLRGAVRERIGILLEVRSLAGSRRGEDSPPFETIRITNRTGRPLHEAWEEWLERYSDWNQAEESDLEDV